MCKNTCWPVMFIKPKDAAIWNNLRAEVLLCRAWLVPKRVQDQSRCGTASEARREP